MNNVFLVFLFTLSQITQAEIIDKTVVVVNNEVILESDVSHLKKSITKPGFIDEALLRSSLQELKSSRSSQLNYLISTYVVKAEIKRLNLGISQERVDQEIRETAKKNNMSLTEFQEAIKTQGISFSEYREFLKDKIEKQSLIESEVISKLRVTDDEAFVEYLKHHPKKDLTVDEFSIAHIFFSPKKGSAEAALSRAKNVLASLHAGADFSALAEQHSEDPNFSAGGFLGSFKSGEFLTEVEASIKSLAIGSTTDIVKSRIGYHIVKLLSKKNTEDPGFTKEKENIKAKLFEARFKTSFSKWLEEKTQASFIRIN